MSRQMLIVALIANSLVGCTSMRPVDVANPSEVTVDAALLDVAKGLDNFQRLGKASNVKYGLLVDEVTVTLKVTASANDSSKLVIDVASVQPSILQGGTIGGKFEQGGDSHGVRDNLIVVKLKNIYTAQLNATGLKQDGIGPITILSTPRERFLAAPLVNNQTIDCLQPASVLQRQICDRFRQPPGNNVSLSLSY